MQRPRPNWGRRDVAGNAGGKHSNLPWIAAIVVIVVFAFILFGYRPLVPDEPADCIDKINAELESMCTAIEATANQGSLQNIRFEVPQCFRDSSVKVSTVKNRTVCSQICQEGRSECISLDFRGSLDFRDDNYIRRVCIQIPVNTVFEGTVNGGPGINCPGRSQEQIPYKLVPFADAVVGVPDGNYVLINKTPQGSSFPVVCAYRMEGN
ncbi:MAG: hypothetical protein NT067_06460 [Candidatus Diapherotrites archaeon]|nr:hypothetical protein [Candidatus Diapherotrites archaeon]